MSWLLGIVFVHAACCEAQQPTPLDLARKASLSASEKLRSATGTGTLEVHLRQKDDKEPALWTKAKVKVFFDRGKYHLRIAFEKRLMRVDDGLGGGLRIVDHKPDDLAVIHDGTQVYVVEFSKNRPPTNCGGQIVDAEQMKSACIVAGFPWADPARFWNEMLNVDRLAQNLGDNAISMVEQEKGTYRGSFPANAPYGHFEVFAGIGFNVATHRVFNPRQKEPVQAYEATWKQSSDVWYIVRYVESRDNREVVPSRGSYSRSVFEYDAFDVNAQVDAKLFTLASVPIPQGTPLYDKRKNAARRNLFWTGTDLSPDPPEPAVPIKAE